MSMTAEEKQAYDWAINQEFQSVAARYARTLARYIQAHPSKEPKLDREKIAGSWKNCDTIGEAKCGDYHDTYGGNSCRYCAADQIIVLGILEDILDREQEASKRYLEEAHQTSQSP